MSNWKLEKLATRVAERLDELSDQKLPMEILRLQEDTAAIVFDVDGVDYIATVSKVPAQRHRPVTN